MKRGRWFLILSVCAACTTAAVGQTPIPADRDQLLSGASANGFSLAERFGYPSPAQVLAKKDELGLTRDKLRRIEGVVASQQVAVKVKGEEIVEAEEQLAKLFEAGTVSEKVLRGRLEQIGKLRAELRFAHLQVYLKMKQILSPNEWARCKELMAGEGK